MCKPSPVAFHGAIFCIAYNCEPFTPMRPIIENLGLGWASQSQKLNDNKGRWTVTMIVTVAQDGKEREMLCLPLRKLPAWLASINPNKVREELRPKIELYQAECDDALWDYWMNGRAECEAPSEIGPSDQNIIQTLVKAIADRYPAEEQKSVYMQIWMRFRNHFRLGSYKQLPPSLMADAVAYLANFKVNGKNPPVQK